MNRETFFSIVVAVVALLGVSCANQSPVVPASVGEYDRQVAYGGQGYPRRTILNHNLQRVLDVDLPAQKRMDSLQLADRLGGDDPAVLKEVSAVLAEPGAPRELRQAVLEYLLKKDYPEIAEHVVAALPDAERRGLLRDEILNWLARHPEPSVLAEIVKLWAGESVTGLNEPRYRQIVERISGRQWDEALLEGLNTPGFLARGSAVEILSRRMPITLLRAEIGRMRPRTDAVAAIRTFIERFDYMPTSRSQLLSTVLIYKMRRDMIDDAARLTQTWRKDFGYRFNIRDFHLLSRIARDPLRTILRRRELILELVKIFTVREHAIIATLRGGEVFDGRFAPQIDSLTISELWNLYLFDEMLTRPRVQMALRIMAGQDRADTNSAWGGLIIYENGQAEAKLYPPLRQSLGDDMVYVPTRKATLDGRDALGRFHAHFERVDNASRAGPTREELNDAKENNYYALVLTSLNRNHFCAHYYNPHGVVISLGTFTFR